MSKKIKFKVEDHDLFTDDCLNVLTNDQLLQAYVIAGCFSIDDSVNRDAWKAAAKNARSHVIRRMSSKWHK